MSAERVATRAELQRIIDEINAIAAIIQEILDRPAPPSRGRIEFEDAVIDLPDEENRP